MKSTYIALAAAGRAARKGGDALAAEKPAREPEHQRRHHGHPERDGITNNIETGARIENLNRRDTAPFENKRRSKIDKGENENDERAR